MTFTTLVNNNTNTSIRAIEQNDIYSQEYKSVRLMLLSLFLFTGLFLNVSLILLFVTRRRILASTNYLSANLAVSNFIACVFILILLIVTLLMPERNIGVNWPCKVPLVITDLWWISQNYTIVFISCERYRNIAYPYKDNKLPSKPCVNTAVIWLITAIMVSLLFTPWISSTYIYKYQACRKDWQLSLSYGLFYTFVSFWIPVIALFYSHIYMLRTCYKSKIMEILSGRMIHPDRTICPDQYTASISRLATHAKKTPVRERSASVADSIGTMRKRSLQAFSKKSLRTILLIFSFYLIATVPQLVIIYMKIFKYEVSIDLETASITKYSSIVSFPYMFGAHSKTIQKELLKMYKRIRCWKSGRISDSSNIDLSDYSKNVERRESRKASLASQYDIQQGFNIPTSRRSSLTPQYDMNKCSLNNIPVINYGQKQSGHAHINKSIDVFPIGIESLPGTPSLTSVES